MTLRPCAMLAGALFLALLPGPAHAHLVGARFGDFYAGVLHPLTALEHVLPLLALGLLAGLQNTKGARLILFLVPLGLVAGVALALLLQLVAVAALVDRASFVILGLLVALGRRLPDSLLAGLAIVFGVSHGYENAFAMSVHSQPHLFGLGVALSGLIVVTLTAAATFALGRSMAWVRIAVRAAGSWIAAIGLMVLVV